MKTTPTPPSITSRMLNTGDRVNAREVERAGRQLHEVADQLDRRSGTSESGGLRAAEQRRQLSAAVDLLERIGAGETPLRRQDFPEDLLAAIERAPVTDKARGTAARHGALLRAWLDEHPPRA